MKTFYFKTRRKQLCGSCHFASPNYFFWLRSNVGQRTTQPTPVGVRHISTTLSAQVWLMMAAICCPILPVASSKVSSPCASGRVQPKFMFIIWLISVCFGCFHFFLFFFLLFVYANVLIFCCLLKKSKSQPTGMRD